MNGRTSEAVIGEVIWRLSPFADVAAPSNWSAELASVVLGNRISGEWPSRDPGVTIYLAGEISRAGKVAIHMHSKRADGSSFAVSDLIGTVRDGRIDAKGSFHDGRGVTLNWSKN